LSFTFFHIYAITFLVLEKLHMNVMLIIKIKGKAIQLQAWTGPEGSRRLRVPDFKTIST